MYTIDYLGVLLDFVLSPFDRLGGLGDVFDVIEDSAKG